jgi:murein DD-endopeptidase MepM/ murein hydrolase activator NlpD
MGYEQETKRTATSQRYHVQSARSKTGKREKPATPREKRRIWQLTISGVILAAAVAIKLLSPGLLSTISAKLTPLIGQDTNFTEAFAAVGKAVSGESGISQALNNAYVAVFGSSEKSSTEKTAQTIDATGAADAAVPVVYSADNLPQSVSLTQRVLGFDYAAPVTGVVTSCFGYRTDPKTAFHYGVDLAADEGTVIGAFADGKVSVVAKSSDLGNYLTVVHPDGFTTLYAHCKRVTASQGQTVRLGDPIAEVGQTGNATGPHLHFELCCDNTYLNPVYYV